MEQPSDAKKLARWVASNRNLMLVFGIALGFVFLGLYSQTQVTLRASRARDFERVSSEFTTSPYILTITYPKLLLLESPDNARAPMTLQLSSRLPLPAPMSSSVTSTPPLFIVTLSSTNEVIEFTDEKGAPLVPRIVLTPTLFTPTVIYLHQATSVTRPPAVQITVHVDDETGNRIPLLSAMNLEIALESGEALLVSRLYEFLGTTSILISLVTGLVGVGWKWWETEQRAREAREREAREQEQKAQEQRERERQAQEQREREQRERERQEQERQRRVIETVLGKVESLQTLLASDLSEAARCYWEYSQEKDFPWQESEVKNRLKSLWTVQSPIPLQHTLTLLQAYPGQWVETRAQIGTDSIDQSLIWAWRMLDKDWQQRIRPMLDETVWKKIEASQWQAILKPWRHVYFWKPTYPSAPPNIAKALELLGLARNPFGSIQAECDELLFDTWIDVEWTALLQDPRPRIVVGKPSSGKTALALFTIRASVCAKTAFPIYVSSCPTEPTRRAQLDYLARAVTRTLLHFVAFYPRSFLEQDVASYSAMAYLLGMYIGAERDLALEFQKAGLEPIGEGRRVLQELERLLANTSRATPPEDEMLALLGAARPYGFPHTIVLVDLPDTTPAAKPMLDDVASVWLDIASLLQGELSYLKILGSDELDTLVKNEVIRLGWSEQQLLMLLRNRLGIVGVESLDTWCDQSARQFSPERLLVETAQGLPGRLIHLGNQLLAQLATHPILPALTDKDLDDVLGKP